MPPPTKGETSLTDMEININTYVNRKERLYSRLQQMYEIAVVAEKNPSQLPYLQARIDELASIRDSYELIIETITKLELKENPSYKPPDMKGFDDLYYEIIRVHKKFQSQESTVEGSARKERSQPRLPEIKLVRFDSSVEQWITFRDTYVSLIHNNESITNVEKFHYLLSIVEGPAQQIIKSLPISNNNYTIVWSSLVDRYENKRAIATRYMDKIFAFKPLSAESSMGLNAFLQTFQESIDAIEALKLPDLSGFILCYMGLRVIDPASRRQFEQNFNQKDIPVFTNLKEFVTHQIRILEMSEYTKPSTSREISNNHNKTNSKFKILTKKTCLASNATGSEKREKFCLFCNKNSHSIYKCYEFIALTPTLRLEKVKELQLCVNCLRAGHLSTQCSSKMLCTVCKSSHHHLLHIDSNVNLMSTEYDESESESSDDDDAECGNAQINETQVSLTCSTGSTVILGTAVIHVADITGTFKTVRVVIDSGSQTSFITNDCAQRLGLPRQKCKSQLTGLGGSVVRDHGIVSCKFKPKNSDAPVLNTNAVVIKKIAGNMPSITLHQKIIEEYKHLSLADPEFYNSSRIDMLLASDVFPYIYDGGKYYPSCRSVPPALHSIFGYVITGQLSSTNEPNGVSTCLFTCTTPKIDDLMKSFWETENLNCDLAKNPDDVVAEHIFKNEHKRDSTGRYIVTYPFKSDAELGESKQNALKRFLNLERKLSRMPALKHEYQKFMHDYAALGHMEYVGDISEVESAYAIPHHCVHKPDSSTTKLRVVFDASCQTTNGKSLNCVLYTGPKLQSDLVELLIRFRLRKISLCGDISKMYRRILIEPTQRKFQHIFWRDSPDESIKVYELCTVTYGVASSPYLAIRTLHQLAEDEGDDLQDAARALREGFFVDDFIWSVDTVEQALHIQHQLRELLQRGGFELRKWSSNSIQVLEKLPIDHLEPPVQFDDGKSMAIKVLGLHWLPKEDCFSFCTSPIKTAATKRTVLSEIAKLFDPLGFVAPCTFLAKNIMQRLWCEQLEWDDPLPDGLLHEWQTFSSQLTLLCKLKHDRHLFLSNYNLCQILGFCDASANGIASVIYLRSQDPHGNVNVSLLLSKSKVAPLKTVSIPRLELMATHLLAKSLNYIFKIVTKEICVNEVLAFTDSSVALTWLNTPPYKLKIFVANRVSKVHECGSNIQWYHVNGLNNPADICSRGATPAQLLTIADQWFRGPQWIYNSRESWPIKSVNDFRGIPPELKCPDHSVLISQNSRSNMHNELEETINRISNFMKLQRIFAWCNRFIKNCRLAVCTRKMGPLCTLELQESHDILIQVIQTNYFYEDIDALKNNKQCSNNLRKLDPFLDSRGILTVGGRLTQADLPYSQRHPILLPKRSHFTNILIDYYHKLYLHAGPRNLQNLLAQRYWIISARCVIRSRLSKCVACFKNKPIMVQPKMAALPKDRLQDVYPFHTIGVDVGGPFYTKESNRRNGKVSKSYLCLFVCYSTRAVHLEVLSALTSECFLASFDRFASRRGLPRIVYSDNGKNFVAANKHLNEVYHFYKNDQNTIMDGFTNRQVMWKFNPPTGSHFGGIFEAGIKSTKYHLKRVIATRALTFEELSTLFTRVEAILNSRPLCSLSSDPNEFDVLTPGHFLVGRQLVAVPNYDLSDEPLYSLSRWQYIQQATTHFWRRWKREYLHTLQQRNKWFVDTPNINVNDLVLVHTENLPSQQWSLARVEQIHPGPDGRVRVVTIRTSNSRLQRPVSKLSPLPKEDDL